jgi:hypothetical protein
METPVIVRCGGFPTPALAFPKNLTVILDKRKPDKLDGG